MEENGDTLFEAWENLFNDGSEIFQSEEQDVMPIDQEQERNTLDQNPEQGRQPDNIHEDITQHVQIENREIDINREITQSRKRQITHEEKRSKKLKKSLELKPTRINDKAKATKKKDEPDQDIVELCYSHITELECINDHQEEYIIKTSDTEIAHRLMKYNENNFKIFKEKYKNEVTTKLHPIKTMLDKYFNYKN